MSAFVSPIQRKLKFIANINDEVLGEDTDPDLEILYVDIGNVDSAGRIDEVSVYRFEDAPSRARRRVRDGDVIISTVRTYLQAIAQIQNPPENMIASTGFAVVRPLPEFDANYCKYVLRERKFLAEVEKNSVGVSYPAINAIDLANIPVHVHPLARQRAIADYLDQETARLDALVAAKEHLLDLLTEKRHALISHAVTQGLDCKCAMKRTNIDFAPEIPEFWEAAKLKRISYMKSGDGITSGAIEEKGLYPVYGGNGLRGYADSFTHDGAFVLIGRQGALCGNVHLVSGQFWASEHAIVATLHEPHNIEWFVNLLKAMNLNRYSESAAQPGLASQDITNLCVPLPPLSQQRAIADYLDRETARLDELAAKTRETIALLTERRAALIAAAVTGQIDVEGAA